MNQEPNEIVIDALNKCVVACNRSTTASLGNQDFSILTKCIQLDIDCADVCALTAALLTRGSKYAKHLLKTCIEMCNACADESEKYSHLEHCRVCAEACRTCAEECASLQSSLLQQFHAL